MKAAGVSSSFRPVFREAKAAAFMIRDSRGTGSARARPRYPARVPGFVLFLVMLIAAVPAAGADNTAMVEAREEAGFGRIIFDFDRLPAYEHAFEAGVFVLSFEKPVEAELGNLPGALPTYIGQVRRDPDGHAFRLALNRAFEVNLMEAGTQLYVDLLPPGWKGPPPSLPSHVIRALSRRAAEAERKAQEEASQREAASRPYELEVRPASHPTFSRLVFDWNRFVTVNLSRQGSRLTLDFGARAEADLARLKTDPPPYLREAELKTTDHDMRLTLVIDENVDVRGFREGNSYVVDLTGPEAAAEAAAADTAEAIGARAGGGGEPVPEAAEDMTRLPAEAGAGTEPERSATDARASAGPELPPMGDPAGEAPEAEIADAALEPERGEAGAKGTEKTRQQRNAQADGNEKTETVEDAGGARPDGGGAETAAPAEIREDGTVVATAEEAGENLRLAFPFPGSTAAAVFRRGRTVWLVFDSTAELDLGALRDQRGGKLAAVRHVRTSSMQYLRLILSRGWLTHVSSNEARWIVEIGDMVGGESEPLRLQRKLRSDNRSLIGIELADPGRVHWLEDPQIGDRLAVVTAHAPQRSVTKPQDFVEFKALATAHGVAIRPAADDLAVRLNLDEVVITRPEGLTLSAGNTHQYAPGNEPLAEIGRLGFLDAEAWEAEDPGAFSDRVHRLQNAVAMSGRDERNEKRFALARVYFANGYNREAIGVLRRMANIDPAMEKDPAFNALRGAVLTLLGRNAKARKDFEVHALANDADAALWVGLLETDDRNWEAALQHFNEGADGIGSYRADLQARFRLAATRSALELKRFSRAAEALDAVPEQLARPALVAERRLLRGWYLEAIGRREEALETYKAVRRGDQRPQAAEAELRRVALRLREEKLSREEAIAALERLQLVWRGDAVEVRTMRLLADLYVEEGRYRDAFELAEDGVKAFPKSRLALAMQNDMKQVFRELYLGGTPENLSALDSLGLFYDFRELMPVGRQGDEMIRRLADSLIEFDLLDQAAELLHHQVNNRLKGAARSQVATRLAMVHLMNHKPNLALGAIRQTRQAGLPNEMQRRRTLLEARALGELGRAEAAVELLGDMEGEAVERLKADALWSARQWQEAGEQIESMLGARWQESGALSEEERFDVLRAAISYSLAENRFALDRIGKKFYEKMMKTRDAEAFVVVTSPLKKQDASFHALAREIGATDTLDAFMKEFRSRYEPQPVSEEGGEGADQAAAGNRGGTG